MFSSPQNSFCFTNLSCLVLEIFRFLENHAQNLNTPQNNSASWDLQMGFNSAFKGLKCLNLSALCLKLLTLHCFKVAFKVSSHNLKVSRQYPEPSVLSCSTECLILRWSFRQSLFYFTNSNVIPSDFLFVVNMVVNMGHNNELLMFWVDSVWCNMKSVIFMQLNSDSIGSVVTLYRLDSLGFKSLQQQPRDFLFSKIV